MIIEDRMHLKEIIRNARKDGKTIVFTNGCFDIIHAGHISLLKFAKSLGDILVVGINTDDSIKRVKGDKRPIIELPLRVRVLDSIKYVDFVIPFDEDTPESLISEIRPDIHVKEAEYLNKPMPEKQLVESYGGRVEFFERTESISTSEIIKRITSRYCG